MLMARKAAAATRFAKKRRFLLLPQYGGRRRAPAGNDPRAAKIREGSRSAQNPKALYITAGGGRA